MLDGGYMYVIHVWQLASNRIGQTEMPPASSGRQYCICQATQQRYSGIPDRYRAS